MQDDVDECRTTYEALNSQLVEELPKLLELGLHIYTASFNEFIRNRKRLVGRITKELLDLMDVRHFMIILQKSSKAVLCYGFDEI